jgi:hypothetical protein
VFLSTTPFTTTTTINTQAKRRMIEVVAQSHRGSTEFIDPASASWRSLLENDDDEVQIMAVYGTCATEAQFQSNGGTS